MAHVELNLENLAKLLREKCNNSKRVAKSFKDKPDEYEKFHQEAVAYLEVSMIAQNEELFNRIWDIYFLPDGTPRIEED